MLTESARAPRRGPADQGVVLGCVRDPQTRARVQTALRGHATLQWFGSFDEIRRALEHGERAVTAVIALSDAAGGTAMKFAHDVHDDMTGTPVVVCCDLGHDDPAPLAALAEAGRHAILIAGMNDESHPAPTVIFAPSLATRADLGVHS